MLQLSETQDQGAYELYVQGATRCKIRGQHGNAAGLQKLRPAIGAIGCGAAES
ncbi:MAG: hypothetical protein ACK526_16830 [Planctomyces sp.]|jgi:hypothetical protein